MHNPLDTAKFYLGHPHNPIPGPVKFYYLVALTFYASQIIILNIEERRKDHWQMFTHHVVTVALIAGSYQVHLTRVGSAILFVLDWCDIFLPLAKMFKYLDLPMLADITFVFFLVSWFITRQVIFVKLVWSVTFEMPVALPLDWNPAEDRLVTRRGWIFFFSSLWILVVLLCLWFYLGCKVAYNVISGKGANDSRSDDEEEEKTPARKSVRKKSG